MVGSAMAQDVPRNPLVPVPPGFETRDTVERQDISGSVSGSIKPQPKTRKVTYVMVSESREWRNLEGQVIRASMLAFDPKPGATGDEPLTLVRGEKVRLLVDGRKTPTEYPVSKLSEQDKSFVKRMVEAQRIARQGGKEKGSP